MSRFKLLLSDAFVSFVWVWSGSLLRYFAYKFLGLGGHHPLALFIKGSLAVLYLVFFALLRKATKGAYNPLMVLCYAISGSFAEFLFTVFGRIPAQVIGSIIAVWLITSTFPEAAHGPPLNVDIHQGTLIEGLLAFMIVMVSLTLKKREPKHSTTKTWIKSISKVFLHLLGSDITGGIMNPAAAFGWAYAQGDHHTKEHWYIYWLAPIEAAMLGVWACSLFIKPKNQEPRSEVNTNLNQGKAYGWLDAQGDFIINEHSSRNLFRCMDMHFCSTTIGTCNATLKKNNTSSK